MKPVRVIVLAVMSLALMAQAKPVLVPDVSARRIEIRYSFSGAQLLLFGAILYPRGRLPERTPDIAVVLRGPVQPILIREKQKIAGIWMNADSARFRSAPAFYALASSRPISQLVDERTAAIYEIGLQNLQLSPGSGALPEKARHFETGLIDLRRRDGVYYEIRAASKSARAFCTERAFLSPARCPSAPTPPKPSSSRTAGCSLLRPATSTSAKVDSSAGSRSSPADMSSFTALRRC